MNHQNQEPADAVDATEAAVLLDGVKAARALRVETAAAVKTLREQRGVTPHLAAVLIGANPASETYVAMKQKACAWVGMESSVHRLPIDATQQQAEDLVSRLSADPGVSGILVQHPLPRHLHEPAVLDSVAPAKDIDGISRASASKK